MLYAINYYNFQCSLKHVFGPLNGYFNLKKESVKSCHSYSVDHKTQWLEDNHLFDNRSFLKSPNDIFSLFDVLYRKKYLWPRLNTCVSHQQNHTHFISSVIASGVVSNISVCVCVCVRTNTFFLLLETVSLLRPLMSGRVICSENFLNGHHGTGVWDFDTGHIHKDSKQVSRRWVFAFTGFFFRLENLATERHQQNSEWLWAGLERNETNFFTNGFLGEKTWLKIIWSISINQQTFSFVTIY